MGVGIVAVEDCGEDDDDEEGEGGEKPLKESDLLLPLGLKMSGATDDFDAVRGVGLLDGVSD